MKTILLLLILTISSCYVTKQRDAEGNKCKVEMKRDKGKTEWRLGY